MPTRPPRGTIYESKFTTLVNGVSSLIIVRIYQKEAIQLDSLYTIVSLNDDRERVPKGSFVINVIDNDENPFSPIKAKEAVFKFFSGGITISNFMKGGSDEWLVVAYTNTVSDPNIFFKGYLLLDTGVEPFEPKPYVVTLRAIDNIGILKSKSIVDFNGNNPRGHYRIIDFIAWSLNQTSLQLPIYVNFNLFEENNPDVPIFESCYLEAKTFEKEATNTDITKEDCYTILQKIMSSFGCRLEQIGGAWWIESIYEKKHLASTVHQFDWDGTYVGALSPTFYLQAIELRGDVDFINDNAQLTIQSPYQKGSIKYEYTYPIEIIDNIGFIRGTEILPTSDTPLVIDGVSYYQTKYTIADWTALEVPTGIIGGTASPSSTNSYIRRLFNDTTRALEQERCVVIEKHSPAKGFYIQSNQIPVNKNDKFDISVDVRWTNDGAFPSSGDYLLPVMQVRLHGDNGNNYMLNGGYQIGSDNYQLPLWKPAGPSFSGVEYVYIQGSYTEDLTQWKTANFITKTSLNPHPCPPIPEDGYIEITLIHRTFADQTDIHFNNLRFNYLPYINGGYGDFKGERHTVSQPSGNYARTYENQIYLNTVKNRLFKGSLTILVSGKYLKAGRLYDGLAFPGGVPAEEFLHLLGYQIAYFQWQQYRTFKTAIESDFYGLKPFSSATIPDLHKQYLFTNPHPRVDNKYFMLLRMQQDHDSQVWSAYLWECIDSTVGQVFSDPYEFRYITG